jgi:hypothetical protein
MYIITIDRDETVGVFFSLMECQEFIAFHRLQKHAVIERLTTKREYPFNLK